MSKILILLSIQRTLTGQCLSTSSNALLQPSVLSDVVWYYHHTSSTAHLRRLRVHTMMLFSFSLLPAPSAYTVLWLQTVGGNLTLFFEIIVFVAIECSNCANLTSASRMVSNFALPMLGHSLTTCWWSSYMMLTMSSWCAHSDQSLQHSNFRFILSLGMVRYHCHLTGITWIHTSADLLGAFGWVFY